MNAALPIVAYLFGSIPVGYLLPRFVSGIDIRTKGSGNPGFTNVFRTTGTVQGVIVLVWDVGKGVLAVLLSRHAGCGEFLVVVTGAAVIAGHVWPVYMKFRGGKGVASAIGVLGSILPLQTLIAFGLLLIIVAATRYISLGSVVFGLSLPVLLLAGGWMGMEIRMVHLVFASIIALVILIRHISNLRRIAGGTENRFSFRGRRGS